MNWSALTKKQQYMVMGTAGLAVVQIFLMAHFLGWTNPSARGGAVKDELRDLESKIDNARSFVLREQSIRENLEDVIGQLQKLTVHTPTMSDRYAWAYEYVSRCATQSGIELDSLEEVLYLNDSKKKQGDEPEPYEIGVSSRCGYNNLVEFLWHLENGNPLLRIKEVRVSAVSEDPQSHRVKILMQWPASVAIKGLK